MPDHSSPRDAILDVLASACMLSRSPAPIGNLIPRRRAYRCKRQRSTRSCSTATDVYDERGNLVEVLGRLSRLDMARAAFDVCIQKPEQTITPTAQGAGDRGEYKHVKSDCGA